MDTITASVIGARHLRVARNGQDAAAAASGPGWAAAVVCDGCSAGAYSEVGARLGAAIVVAALARRLAAGAMGDLWPGVQAEVVAALAALADRMGEDRVRVVVDHFLFTIVAVAATREATSVWAIGDGAYSFGERTRVLGPFADNQPPYLGYALLGDAPHAHVEMAPVGTQIVAIATDGALDLGGDVARFAKARYLEHADRARRELSVLARGREVIDWEERRVVRTAELQDDCAIAVVRVPRASDGSRAEDASRAEGAS
ncbi:MAG: protein phosphatase 2C domain-containing protein [Deltaproteobacteria bacterium]|nr:protein phosphatase 2C domain-containing protein [Deltaproteobacteria bacterium]